MKKNIFLVLCFIFISCSLCKPHTSLAEDYDGVSFDVTVDSPDKKGVETCFYFFDKFSGQWLISGWYQLNNGFSKLFVDTKYPVVGYLGTSGDYYYSSQSLEHDVLYHDVSKNKLTILVGTKPDGNKVEKLGFIIAPVKNGIGKMDFTKEFLYKRQSIAVP